MKKTLSRPTKGKRRAGMQTARRDLDLFFQTHSFSILTFKFFFSHRWKLCLSLPLQSCSDLKLQNLFLHFQKLVQRTRFIFIQAICPKMSGKANSTHRRASLPLKPINSLYYPGSLCRGNGLMLCDSHNVCATVLPKNGISLFSWCDSIDPASTEEAAPLLKYHSLRLQLRWHLIINHWQRRPAALKVH